KPLHSAPSPQPGALSPYSAFRRILHQQREAARYAPPQSNAIWPFPVIKSFFFVLRLVVAWFLAVLLVGMMWSELPLLGRVEWPIVLLGMATMALVVAGALSHLGRVRLIAGHVDK